MTSPASLLALASSLDAQGDALKAQAASIRATLGGREPAVESAANIVNVAEHARLVGCAPRKAREFMLRAERAGFDVRRVGRSLFMERTVWDRAVTELQSKRERPKSQASDADALLDAVGALPVRGRRRAA
jgi:hypothetical protein